MPPRATASHRSPSKRANLNGGTKLYWWNGTAWALGRAQTYNSSTGCVTLIVNGSSSPTLSQLTGTYFAAGQDGAWQFIGFTSPVDNPSVMNSAKAGQTIPLKWRLLDAAGVPVTNLTTAKVTVAQPQLHPRHDRGRHRGIRSGRIGAAEPRQRLLPVQLADTQELCELLQDDEAGYRRRHGEGAHGPVQIHEVDRTAPRARSEREEPSGPCDPGGSFVGKAIELFKSAGGGI